MSPDSLPLDFTQILPSKKGKERERDREAPQPTDFAARMVALQRKQAQQNKPKDRPDRPLTTTTSAKPQSQSHSPRRMHAPPLTQPNIIVSHPSPLADSPAPDARDFDRRLKISSHSSPRQSHKRAEHTSPRGAGRLYNPNTDSIRRPLMTAEPDAMSEDESAGLPRSATPSTLPRFARTQPGRPPGEGHRLFDPRKDNPYLPGLLVRQPLAANDSPPLGVRSTPTPKSSGDWVSASSTSSASYAQSSISSNFTLNSTTTDSSASSAIFSNGPRSEDSTASTGRLSATLKLLYRRVVTLETQVIKLHDHHLQNEGESSPQTVLLKAQMNGLVKRDFKAGSEEAERKRYRDFVQPHKDLSEVVYELLSHTMAPSVPVSLKHIPKKYGLVTRMWTHAFYHLLESLRRAATSCPPEAEENIALEHLVSFIYYAYKFYSGLLDQPNLKEFNSNWVESLGDLARYRMAVAALLEARNARITPVTLNLNAVTRAALAGSHLSPGPATPEVSALSDKNVSPTPVVSPMRVARIDDSPAPSDANQVPLNPALAPSVGIIAARQMEMLPEKEQWRQISREWFTKGLAFSPSSGKLHHHLGMLSRDAEDIDKEDLRAVYHFTKSMTALHPFETARETVLSLWSSSAQIRRQAPDAGLTELYLLLQGMIFTNIQLDDFQNVLSRFEEKLVLEGRNVEERDWIMMAVINIGSIFEYGRSSAILRRVSGIQWPTITPSPVATHGAGKIKVIAQHPESQAEGMDVDDETEKADAAIGVNGLRAMAIGTSPPAAEAVAVPHDSAGADIPQSLKYALQLTFSMLTHTLKNPIRQPHALSRSSLNPYIPVMLTFLSTVLKDRTAERVLSRAVPWEALAQFLTTQMPRRVIQRETMKEVDLLTASTSPLPEDWCLRGLGWSGKKIYERGFWSRDTNGEDKNLETEILDRREADGGDVDAIIEDEDEADEHAKSDSGQSLMRGRWVRIARSAVRLGRIVNGFMFMRPVVQDERGEWRVEGALADKVAKWREEDRREKAEEERRLRGTRWGDDDDGMDVDEDDFLVDGDEMSEDEDEVSEDVKALKDRLKHLQNMLVSSKRNVSPRQRTRALSSRDRTTARLRMVPGYTVLVVDTNILLSSLSMLASLVESLQWTIVIPLPVIMELDGLASDPSVLGEAAATASAYIVSHLRSHAASLKIQTSKGNYLTNLNVRTEQVDLRNDQSSERNMDDLILRAAIWQTAHWADRSVFLQAGDSHRNTNGASKVVLLTFDRMLRVKARAREVDAASEHDLAAILAGKP